MNESAKTHKLTIGIDIGGTKVAAGLVDSKGKVLFKTRVPMVATGDAVAGFAAVKNAIDAVLNTQPRSRKDLAGIGICSPGPLDPWTGVVINPPNLPCWRNFPLAAEVERAFGVVAHVDNDANAAALAESIWGTGVGYQNVFYATVGTGIGTGIIFRQRIYYGRTGSAAEGGHVSIDYQGPKCGCGKRGCIEALASGPALARRARQRLAGGQASDSKILTFAGGNSEAITSEIIVEAHRAGDPLAKELLKETADYLAMWLGNVIDLLEPDVILIGGGMSGWIESWFEHIRGLLPACSINQRCQEIPLKRAAYGEDSGIAGAAALLHQADRGLNS
jgi:glucokinase